MNAKEVSAIVEENNLLRSKMSGMMAENIILQEKVSGLQEKLFSICKLYFIIRPGLQFIRLFSFVKKGLKVLIDVAIVGLDAHCSVK